MLFTLQYHGSFLEPFQSLPSNISHYFLMVFRSKFLKNLAFMVIVFSMVEDYLFTWPSFRIIVYRRFVIAIGWLTNNYLNFSVNDMQRGTLCSAPHGFFFAKGPITDMLLLVIFLSMITILLRKYKGKLLMLTLPLQNLILLSFLIINQSLLLFFPFFILIIINQSHLGLRVIMS